MKQLIKLALLSMVVLSVSTLTSCENTKKNGSSGWAEVDKILKNIVPPTFPDKTFDITNYGAVADGTSNSLSAIIQAIEECNKAGGGKVVVPAGEYYSAGPIVMKSNVNLYLDKEAIIKFSTQPDNYLPVVHTFWEGMECMNYSSLVYAYEVENIALTGEGILDGQAGASNWWSWKGKKRKSEGGEYYGWEKGMPSQRDENGVPLLNKMNDNKVPVEERIFGKGHYLRPNFVQFIKCKNILIEGVTITNSPMWMLHPVLSENITIRNAKIVSKGPNADGCDPEFSKNILIENTYFDNGDDCIAIKSGRNNDGRRINVPSENIIIRNCKMKNGHGGVVLGSEASAGIRNVFAENCKMDSPSLERALRIKSNKARGGVIENIYFRNVEVGQVKEAVVKINMFYSMSYNTPDHEELVYYPQVKNVVVENVSSRDSKHALLIRAYENFPAENVVIRNCSFDGVKKENILENVKGLVVENTTINGEVYKLK